MVQRKGINDAKEQKSKGACFPKEMYFQLFIFF